MFKKPNNLIALDTDITGLFKLWFQFIKPLHNLTERQIDVIAMFVKLRYELSKVISDEYLLDENIMSETSKKKVREACNMSYSHFLVIMAELRKNKVLINNKINPKFIPRIDKDNENNFYLLLWFKVHE